MSDGPRFLTPPETEGWTPLDSPIDWAGLAILVLLVLFFLRSLWRQRNRSLGLVVRQGKAGATCKWRKDKVKRGGTLERWQCKTCGVDAFSHDGKPPKDCKRNLREAQP